VNNDSSGLVVNTNIKLFIPQTNLEKRATFPKLFHVQRQQWAVKAIMATRHLTGHLAFGVRAKERQSADWKVKRRSTERDLLVVTVRKRADAT
jgi:hypothetical protein